MSVDTRTWLVNSMNRHMFFEGKRIVDIWAGHRTSFAMDEDGNLWSWGYNNFGQLGYPTNTGFRSSDRSRTPKKLPVNWNSYGGIQKFITSASEANNDFIVALTVMVMFGLLVRTTEVKLVKEINLITVTLLLLLEELDGLVLELL